MKHVRLLILLSLAGPAARAEVGPLVLTDLAGAYAPGSLPAGGGWLALECGGRLRAALDAPAAEPQDGAASG